MFLNLYHIESNGVCGLHGTIADELSFHSCNDGMKAEYSLLLLLPVRMLWESGPHYLRSCTVSQEEEPNSFHGFGTGYLSLYFTMYQVFTGIETKAFYFSSKM